MYLYLTIVFLFLAICNGNTNPHSNPSMTNRKYSHNMHNHGTKHMLCTDLKKIPGLKNGAFITRDRGTWRYRLDGSKEYTIDTCKLKRFTATEARQCLSGHHMLWIGDSVTRYQFIILSYFIEHGSWPPRFGRPNPTQPCEHIDENGHPTCSPIDEPNLAKQNDWKIVYGNDDSWMRMHMFLGGSGLNGHMEYHSAKCANSIDNMHYSHAFINDTISSPSPRSNTDTDNDTHTNAPVRLSYLSSRGSSMGPMHVEVYFMCFTRRLQHDCR